MTDTTAVPGPAPEGEGTSHRPRRNARFDRLTPEQRSLRARLASHASWARTADPSARTAPARDAFLRRFEQQVDPGGTMDPAERIRRAEHARKAHMQALALKSARTRRARRNGKGGERG
jgi:hypothetical protein